MQSENTIGAAEFAKSDLQLPDDDLDVVAGSIKPGPEETRCDQNYCPQEYCASGYSSDD